MVARATDGAAEMRPAKLFGFNTSPSKQKAETTVPPTSIRITRSVVIGSFIQRTILRAMAD